MRDPAFVLAVFCLTLLLTGCTSDKPTVDYQKMADEAGWMPPKEDFLYCLMHEARAYQLDVVRKKEGHGLMIRVSDADGERYSFTGDVGAVFFERDGVLYHTVYRSGSSGCTIVAFDLKKKQQLWKTDLRGIGAVEHSKYSNVVRMDPHFAGMLVVYGHEAFGRYVEIIDRETGKTVGHKVFKKEK
jgi:hypothetical protein